MDFYVDKMVILQINGIKYGVHNYIAKSMDICRALDDCGGNLLEIAWNIKPENVNRTLHAIYGDGTYEVENVDDKIEIISFIRYLCVPNWMIDTITTTLFRKYNIRQFIEYCAQVSYDDIFEYILNVYSNKCTLSALSRGPIKQQIKQLNSIGFRKKFKNKVMIDVVSLAIPFYCRFNCERHMTNIPELMLDIAGIYEYFGLDCESEFFFPDTIYNDPTGYADIIRDSKLIIAPDIVVFINIIAKNIVAKMLVN